MFPECPHSFESDVHVKDDRGVSFGRKETEDVFRDVRLQIVRKSVFENVFVGRALMLPSVVLKIIFISLFAPAGSPQLVLPIS